MVLYLNSKQRETVTFLLSWTVDMGLKRARLETVEVEGMDLYAYESGKYKLYVDEDLMVDHGKYIVIWKKAVDGNDWKMYRDIWNTSMLLLE